MGGCNAPDYLSLGSMGISIGEAGPPGQAEHDGSVGPTSSGLPWPSGVNVWSRAAIVSWESFRGRPTDVVGIIPDYESWDGITKPAALLAEFSDYAGQLVIAEPFWPLQSGGDLGACAQGAYDLHWNDFGTTLVQAGRAGAIVRLAWQFNGNGVEWRDSDKVAWKACFQRVVAAIRATAPAARINWSMSTLGPLHSNGSAFDVYPGDAFVDVIGVDAYDMTPASPDEAAWSKFCDGPEGLCQIATFARQNHKQLGIGQWAVVTCGAYTDRGGDNPFFIQKMHDLFVANQDILAFENYYNDHIPNEFCTSLDSPVEAPLASARYRELWGK
jgi:Glycosyl hydrolase family 26